MKLAVYALLACVPLLLSAQQSGKKPLFTGQSGKVIIPPGKPAEPILSLNEPTPKEKEVLEDFPHEYEKAYRKILIQVYHQRKIEYAIQASNNFDYMLRMTKNCAPSRSLLMAHILHVTKKSEKTFYEVLEIGPPVPLEFINPIGVGSCARTAPKGKGVFVRGNVANACYVCTGVRMVDGERVCVIDAIPLEEVTWMYREKKQ